MVRRTVSKKEDGTCNVLIVVPHGHDDDDRNAEKLGAYVADALDSYAVINNQLYQKPPKGGHPNPKNHVMDLNVPKQAHQCVNDYWNPLLNLVREINEKHGQRALLFFIHGIGDGNADAQIPAPDIIVGKGFIPNPDDPKVGKYDAKAASASEMFFDELIDGIKDMGVVRDDVPNYQGSRRLPRHLYEERHNLKIDIEGVQLNFATEAIVIALKIGPKRSETGEGNSKHEVLI